MKLPTETGPWAWETKPGRFSGGTVRLRIGRIVVAEVAQAIVAKGEPTRYNALILLPGVRVRNAGNTEVEAKTRAEHAVRTWFRWISEAQPAEGEEG